ncbi:hypothetical protein niasHT_017390 [Heterodera trifolii]|uniref:DUF148 domain-containing protein n=1 Tax=Heterodera trifolii TaxID=157864 RepID=A0ABD2KXA8_9BILA
MKNAKFSLPFLLFTTFARLSVQCVPPRTAPLFFFPSAPTPISLVQMHLIEQEMGEKAMYIPKFLRGSPLNKFYEYKALLETLGTQRDDQILDKFGRWLNAQTELIKSKYLEYDIESNETIPLFQKLREEKTADYSQKTAEIDSEMILLITNPYLVAVDKIKQMLALLKTMPDKQCDQIAKAWRQIRIEYAKNLIEKAEAEAAKKEEQSKRQI